jgi:hypothetical protein
MTRLHRTWVATILIVAALALGACGDDEGGGESATTGTDTVATDTGTTGTETTETTETKTGKTGTTETRERERERERSSGGGSGSGSGGGSSGSGGGSSNKESPDLNAGNAEKTAKTVCSGFLPKPTERDIKSGKKSREEVARAYARGFPRALRDDAYKGCLAGLPKKG